MRSYERAKKKGREKEDGTGVEIQRIAPEVGQNVEHVNSPLRRTMNILSSHNPGRKGVSIVSRDTKPKQ